MIQNFVLKFWEANKKDRRSRHPSTTSADCQTADGKKARVGRQVGIHFVVEEVLLL